MNLYQYLKLDVRLARVEYLSFILFWVASFEVVLFVTFLSVNYTNHENLNHVLLFISWALYFWVMIKVIILSIRRLHDINLNGWFVLALFFPGIGYLVVLILCIIPGILGNNQFGIQRPKPSKKEYRMISYSAIVILAVSIAFIYLIVDVIAKMYGG